MQLFVSQATFYDIELWPTIGLLIASERTYSCVIIKVIPVSMTLKLLLRKIVKYTFQELTIILMEFDV